MIQPDDLEQPVATALFLPAGERCRLLSLALSGFGYAPLVCRSGSELHQAFAAGCPGVAVVDLRLEGAFALCERLRQGGEVAILGLNDPNRQVGARLALPVDMVRSADASIEEILLALRQLVIGKRVPPGSAAGMAAGEARR